MKAFIFALLLIAPLVTLAQSAPAVKSTTEVASPAVLGAKIGFVHNERVLRESPAATRATAKLDAEFAKRIAEVKALGDRVAEIQRQLDRSGLTMAELERRSKERELTVLQRDFQRGQSELREDLQLRQSEVLRTLADQANRIIRRIAESEKFDIIFQQDAVVFVSERIDLTDRVIKEMGE